MATIPNSALQQIFLHIGRGKTGTTAVQAFCHNNREQLRSNGIHYLLSDSGAGGHQNLAKAFIDKPPHYMTFPADSRSELLERAAAELRTVDQPACLISSENLVFAELERLATYLADVAPTAVTKIIYFARSQDELAESEYNQMIKWTGLTKSFQDYVSEDFSGASFYRVLEPWAKVFGRQNIIAKLYRADRSTIIEDMLSCLPGASIEDARLDQSKSAANSSTGRLAIELCREVNGLSLDIAAKRELNGRISKLLRAVDHPGLFFTATEAARFRARFQADNRLFISEYLDGHGSDLLGRRYSDTQRDEIVSQIQNSMNRSHYWRDKAKLIDDWL